MLRISDVEPTTALDGLFTNGKVANGIPPTRLVAEWFNAIQTELINVVEGARIEINPEDNDQVLKAIKIITQGMLPSIPVTSVNNKTGAVTLVASDVNAFPSKGGTVGSDGVTTPGLLVNGSNLPINGQGVHLAWNESGSNGEGNLICNKGSGQGGFVLRTVNVDNTTETGRVTISGNGDLNTSRYLSEAGQRVYSPNNPPPVNITGAVTGGRLSGRTVVADTGGRIDLPPGCVFTGMSGANYSASTWAAYSAVQININGVWATVATV